MIVSIAPELMREITNPLVNYTNLITIPERHLMAAINMAYYDSPYASLFQVPTATAGPGAGIRPGDAVKSSEVQDMPVMDEWFQVKQRALEVYHAFGWPLGFNDANTVPPTFTMLKGGLKTKELEAMKATLFADLYVLKAAQQLNSPEKFENVAKHLTMRDTVVKNRWGPGPARLKPVIVHAVRELEAGGERADVVVVLQATTPFRSHEAIDAAVRRLVDGGFDAVVSVTEDRTLKWREEGGRLVPLFGREGRRERQPPVYRENGAVVALRRATLDLESRFGEKVGFEVLDKRSGFTVYDLDDFWMAERLLAQPRILFRVDGGGVLGMGHVYRSLAIADALGEA